MHLQDPEPKSWLQQRIEGLGKEISFTPEGRKAILNKLIETEGFEKFLGVKYMGTKRFGLDGGEGVIPAMEQIIKRGGAMGAKEVDHRHAAPRPAEHPGERHGKPSGRSSTSSRAAASSPRMSMVRAM